MTYISLHSMVAFLHHYSILWTQSTESWLRLNIVRRFVTVFSILSQLATLQPPDGIDLFPPSIYGWLPVNENEPNCDIHVALDAAVTQGAEDWYGATSVLKGQIYNRIYGSSNCTHLLCTVKLNDTIFPYTGFLTSWIKTALTILAKKHISTNS